MASDEELQAAVDEELTWDPRVGNDKVSVTVRNGVATLRGTVGSYVQKRVAGADAAHVPGVAKVDDALEVQLLEAFRRSDTEVRAAVESALRVNSELHRCRIEVQVDDGWVTLSGTVCWHYERVIADRIASSTVGVYGVTNDLEITPTVHAARDLPEQLHRALSRTVCTDRLDLAIGVSPDGVVTLHGAAASAGDRDRMLALAWSAPGVVEVVNDIQLVWRDARPAPRRAVHS